MLPELASLLPMLLYPYPVVVLNPAYEAQLLGPLAAPGVVAVPMSMNKLVPPPGKDAKYIHTEIVTSLPMGTATDALPTTR